MLGKRVDLVVRRHIRKQMYTRVLFTDMFWNPFFPFNPNTKNSLIFLGISIFIRFFSHFSLLCVYCESFHGKFRPDIFICEVTFGYLLAFLPFVKIQLHKYYQINQDQFSQFLGSSSDGQLHRICNKCLILRNLQKFIQTDLGI